MKPSGTRALFWVSAVLSVATGLLGVLTLVSREWIEALSGWDPDHGNGSAEAWTVVTLGVASVVTGLIARHARQRLVVLTQAA